MGRNVVADQKTVGQISEVVYHVDEMAQLGSVDV